MKDFKNRFVISLFALLLFGLPPTFAAAAPASCIDPIVASPMLFDQERERRLEGLLEEWARQDAEVLALRNRSQETLARNLSALQASLAMGSETQKESMRSFEEALAAAGNQRQLAVGVATRNFRGSVQGILQPSGPPSREAAAAFCATLGQDIPTPSGREMIEGFQMNAWRERALRRLSEQYRADLRSATADFQAKVLAATVAFKSGR